MRTFQQVLNSNSPKEWDTRKISLHIKASCLQNWHCWLFILGFLSTTSHRPGTLVIFYREQRCETWLTQASLWVWRLCWRLSGVDRWPQQLHKSYLDFKPLLYVVRWCDSSSPCYGTWTQDRVHVKGVLCSLYYISGPVCILYWVSGVSGLSVTFMRSFPTCLPNLKAGLLLRSHMSHTSCHKFSCLISYVEFLKWHT